MSIKCEIDSCVDFRCVLCGGTSTRLFEVSGYWIRRCADCGHEFTELTQLEGHTQRVYGHDYFFEGGAGYNNYLHEETLLLRRGAWYAQKMSRYLEPATVLEVGAAAGFTLQGFAKAGWQCHGIEPNAEMAGYASQRFGFPVETASLESWTTDQEFHLVIMLQVLAHLADPREALSKVNELLLPGGYLLAETWNRASWTAWLFGKNWHEYSPPSVLHLFSSEALKQLAGEYGLRQIASGRPSKWIQAAHAKSLLRHKASTSSKLRLIFGLANLLPDRVAIPYPSEDLRWMLFRRDS